MSAEVVVVVVVVVVHAVVEITMQQYLSQRGVKKVDMQ